MGGPPARAGVARTALTAIARNRPSAPARWLAQEGLLRGRLLDYGSGRGADARAYKMAAYDPHFAPERPAGRFDTVLCTYVLNVLPDRAEREAVLDDVLSLLRPGGSAYVTVRNDRAGLGGWTSRGTWQGAVVLPWPVVRRTAGWVMYHLTKEPRCWN